MRNGGLLAVCASSWEGEVVQPTKSRWRFHPGALCLGVIPCAAFLATLLLTAGSASAVTMLGVAWDGIDSPVYTINPLDGSRSFLGYSGMRGLNSLTRTSANEYLSVSTNPGGSVLVRIDPGTGQGTPIAVLSSGGVRGLAASATDALYAALDGGQILKLEQATGGILSSFRVPFVLLQALTFSPDGTLYGWDAVAGLVVIDPVAAAGWDVNAAMGGTTAIQSLAFDSSGTLFGVRNSLFHISTATGEATAFGLTEESDLRGLEVIVPEPASLLLLLSASGLMAYCRRAHRPR